MPDEPAAREPLSPADTVETALVRAARALTMSLQLDDVCRAVLEGVQEVFGATSSWILLHDNHSRTLRTVAAVGPCRAAFDGLTVPEDAGVVGLAFRTRRAVFVPVVGDDDRWYDPARVKGSGLQSIFVMPMLNRDEAVGVVGLDAPRFSAGRPPTQADRDRLEAFASQAAIAVANARLYDASERDRRRLLALLDERRRLRGDVSLLEEAVRTTAAFGEIEAEDPAFLRALDQADLVAPGDTTVLLLGETGTGKELLARHIHGQSRRAHGPFVAVNCAALPPPLVESELFGHEKGAFTGALVRKPGQFELANRGTILLDEIGDLPVEAQAKLLRVLQDGQVQHVGGTSAIPIDVRVIAATNQDLEAAVADRRFRADLFYRLSVFPIHLPALRDRHGDIVLLARHFLAHFAAKLQRQELEFSEGALDRLRGQSWPGNVRELQNVVERAVILTKDGVVAPEAIAVSSPPPAPDASGPRAGETLADVERRAILAALDASTWRVSGPFGAARALGLKPTTLHARMKKLGIRRPLPAGPSRK